MNWRNLQGHDYFLFARSFHSAAQKLAGTLHLEPVPIPNLDVCPVLSMYRRAVELHLKVIVLGDGGNFLATRPDELSVHKTRSLSWLAQFVCQIVTALGWEEELKCEGVENLAEFRSVIEEVNAIDPPFQAFRFPAEPERAYGAPSNLSSTVPDFVRRLDALVVLLEHTADGLAAEWDLRSEGSEWRDGNDSKPTIQ